jgi:O-antigen/teichoic acid export membrane protein
MGAFLKPFDANGQFLPVSAGVELRRQAIRGVGVTVFTQGLVFVLQLVSTIVLARLLTPRDFGLVTMVTTFSLPLASFGLNGFTDAILQSKEVNHNSASNLFWINVGVGSLLALGFAVAGSLLKWFYHNPSVAPLAAGLSVTIFLSGTSVIHIALLKRAMGFSAASAIEFSGRAIYVAVSVLFGWLGWGYWSLVIGSGAQAFATTVGAFWLCRWIPGVPRRATGTSSMIRFALHAYGRFGLNYSARNMDNLLVGWRFGAPALGFYKKAYDLFLLPSSQLLSPVVSVAISTLSKLNQDRVQYRRNFLRSLSVVALIGMPIGADLILIGNDLISILLGPGWEMAGEIFVFFGPGVGVMLIYNTLGWIHLSTGRADRWFRWTVIEFAVTALLFLMALRWGPIGVAAAWTVSLWILTIPAFWYAGKPIQLEVSSVLGSVWKFLLASVVSCTLCFMILRSIPFLSFGAGTDLRSAIARLCTTSVLFLFLYVVAVIVLHRGPGPIQQFAGLIGELLPRSGLLRRVLPTRTIADRSKNTLQNLEQRSAATPTDIHEV